METDGKEGEKYLVSESIWKNNSVGAEHQDLSWDSAKHLFEGGF